MNNNKNENESYLILSIKSHAFIAVEQSHFAQDTRDRKVQKKRRRKKEKMIALLLLIGVYPFLTHLSFKSIFTLGNSKF